MPFDLSAINWIAVVVSAVAAFMVGGIWYGAIFGKKWVEIHGHSEAAVEAMQKDQAKVFAGFFVGDLIMSAVIAAILTGLAEPPSAATGAFVGFCLWLGVAATIGHAKDAANRRPAAAFYLDAGHELILLVAVGAILGAWQ